MVGYKPPYGRYPLPAGASFDPYVQGGPMTRTVADAARMSNIMSGPDPLDHTALTRKLTIPTDSPGVTGMRIAVSYDLGHYQVIDEVRRETRAALDALADAGAEIVEVNLGGLSETIRLAHGAQEFVSAGAITEAVEKHGNLVSDYVPELARTAQSFSADDCRRGLSLAGEDWRDRLGSIFREYNAFICPTVSCPEVPAENWQQTELMINGHSLTDTDTAMTALFNMFSRCPVLAVPSGMTDAGLPTGIQIVGRPLDDPAVFRVAHALERQRPWLNNPARRPSLATMTKLLTPNPSTIGGTFEKVGHGQK